MSRVAHPRGRHPRRGAAAVELAVLLPLLCFMLVATVDYARIYYYAVTLSGCARNGAIYGRRSPYDPVPPYASLKEAALADATNLTPPPTISTREGIDADGNPFIEVKASYQYRTFANYPGIPPVVDLERVVRMPIAPDSPRS